MASKRINAFKQDGWIFGPDVGAKVYLPFRSPFLRAARGEVLQVLLGGFMAVRYRHGPYERTATLHREDTRPAE